MAAPRKYPDELRERAVRLVFESRRPIARVSCDLGIHKEALRHWVRQAEADSGRRRNLLTTDEREELKRLRKENAELKRANAILKEASLFSTPRRNTSRSLFGMEELRCGGSGGSTRRLSVGSCGIVGSAASRSARLAGRSIERPARSTARSVSTAVWFRSSGGGVVWL
jgi:transposase